MTTLVRGTTCSKIINLLYFIKLGQSTCRIACPEIKFPDFYGVDMPTKKELLSSNKNIKEICDYLGANSVNFLTIEIYKA